MMNKYKNISIIILLILILYLGFKLFKKEDPKIIKVPVIMEIPVSGISDSLPPVILPIPKKEKSKPKIIREFIKSDSIVKDSLYQNSVTERIYEEIFKDTVQDITVTSTVQGKLLKQELKYNIYPRMVKIDTFVDYKLNNKIKVYGFGKLGSNVSRMDPVYEAGLLIIPKNDKKAYSISTLRVEANNYIMGGYYVKF